MKCVYWEERMNFWTAIKSFYLEQRMDFAESKGAQFTSGNENLYE